MIMMCCLLSCDTGFYLASHAFRRKKILMIFVIVCCMFVCNMVLKHQIGPSFIHKGNIEETIFRNLIACLLLFCMCVLPEQELLLLVLDELTCDLCDV